MHYEKIELPAKSVTLTKEEYQNLLNQVKAKVLGYASVVDTQLTEILTEIFLLDFDRKGIWFDTVFDEDHQATFGSRIVWLGKVMANHDEIIPVFGNDRRKTLIKKLNDISKIRNLFAHTMTFRDPPSDAIEKRTIFLMDFKEMGSNTIVKNMYEIAELVNDETVMKDLSELIRLSITIRRKRVDEMCQARRLEKDYLEQLKETMGDPDN